MSMNPGATTHPDASSSSSPLRLGAISRTTPPAIATSATRPGAPLPSTTVPPRMTVSAAIGAPVRVDHELEEVAVRVARVHARRRSPAPAFARDRSLLDGRTHIVEERVQLVRRPVPHEAEIAARWLRGRRAQREPFALPDLGTVQVDHLPPGVHGHDVRVL